MLSDRLILSTHSALLKIVKIKIVEITLIWDANLLSFHKGGVTMTVYQYSAETIDGKEKLLSDYKGKVLLIVNTASQCGFTPQFDRLQKLYDTYKDDGFDILGFPCNQFGNQDPGTNDEIQSFCQKNYGVTFQMFSKVEVKGEKAHPLFIYLTEHAKGLMSNQIKWNFTKFLINKQGEVIDRFAPQTDPAKIHKEIESALKA